LYDHGTLVIPSKILHPHLTEPFIGLNPVDAETQKAADGMTVNVGVNGSSAPAVVKIDANIPAGFALVPRSCGIPVVEPTEISIRIAEAIEA